MQTERIYQARNRNKKQYKVFLREATASLLSAVGGNAELSRSEVLDALANSFLRKIGKDVSFLHEQDLLNINKLKRAITQRT
jgi:hypothetical protein